MTNISISQIADDFRNEIGPLYPPEETEALLFRILQHTLSISRSDIWLRPDTNVPKSALCEIEKIILGLKKFEPLQYILGETTFYGLDLRVNHSVLIPRPETEELVDWVLKENTEKGLKVIDLGTGSGCIAIAIAKNRESWEVMAADISPDALNQARENAALNKANVSFLQEDMRFFSDTLQHEKFSLIISNPPYVTAEQKHLMQPNVLDYEPHLALFAPGTDPLLFYRAIAAFAATNLEINGKVYVEINEDLPQKTAGIFEEKGFATQLAKDINGKYRMLKAYRHD